MSAEGKRPIDRLPTWPAPWGGIIKDRPDPHPLVTTIVCDRPGRGGHHSWLQWPDGPEECPVCVPGQPPSLYMRLTDPLDFLGPMWVWCAGAGHRGMWVHQDELLVSDISLLEEMRELYGLLSEPNPQERITASVAKELRRLKVQNEKLRHAIHQQDVANADDVCSIISMLPEDADHSRPLLERARKELERLRSLLVDQGATT